MFSIHYLVFNEPKLRPHLTHVLISTKVYQSASCHSVMHQAIKSFYDADAKNGLIINFPQG